MNVADIEQTQLEALTKAGYTADDLSMLAPSEVQALLAPDSEDQPGGGDPHEAALAEQERKAEEGAAQEGAKTSEGAAADADDDADDADDTTSAAPAPAVVQAPDTAESDAKIAELKAEKKAAFKRLMDGEIDADEYQSIEDGVNSKIDGIREQVVIAKAVAATSQHNAEQAAINEWRSAESAAFDSFKAEGLDYKARPALLAAYNTHLKSLGADPKNERRDASWFLAEAHRMTKADLGIVTAPKATQRQQKNDPAGLDLANLPPTLRATPAAATGAIEANEFAYLDRLSPLEQEREVAKMTDAQRDRWLNS